MKDSVNSWRLQAGQMADAEPRHFAPAIFDAAAGCFFCTGGGGIALPAGDARSWPQPASSAAPENFFP